MTQAVDIVARVILLLILLGLPIWASATNSLTEKFYEKAFYSVVKIELPGNSNCTGVLLDQDHVLTAAHCFERGEHLQSGQVRLHILDKETSYKSFVVAPIKKISIYSEAPKMDLAILKLQNSIPQKLNEARFHFILEHPKVPLNSHAVLLGYGISLNEKENLEIQKQQVLSRISAKVYDLRMGKRQRDHFLVLNNKKANACSGDSGGPLIATSRNGQAHLIGIITSVIADPLRYQQDSIAFRDGKIQNSEFQTCTGLAVFLDITQFKSWIERQMQGL